MNKELLRPYAPYAALVVGVLALGSSGIFIRHIDAPGIVSGFYRIAVGAIFLLPAFARRRRREVPNQTGVMWAVGAGLFFACDMAFFAMGIDLSGAVNPTLLTNTAPVWVGLAAWLWLGEELNGRFWLGLLIGLGGAALMVGYDWQQSLQFGRGSLFGLLSGFFYGGYFLLTQLSRRTLSSISSFWISAVSSVAGLMIISKLLGYALWGYAWSTFGWFIIYGIVVQIIGYLAVNYALGQLPASVVSPSMLGQPVVTALLAGPLIGEAVHAVQIYSGMLILCGIYMVHSRHFGRLKGEIR